MTDEPRLSSSDRGPDRGETAPPCPAVAVQTPRVRPSIATPLSLVWLGIGTAFVLWATAANLEGGVFVAAAGAALAPLPLYIGIALWFDRMEPEPSGMLLMAFLWGASVAILFSGLVNNAMDAAIGERLSSITTAPIIEEMLKAAILFRFYAKKKTEFDGVVDGLIYAAMVGLGFACVENVDYYSRALMKQGTTGLAVSFTVRGVMGPFAHPLFTGVTGIGLGLARQTHRRWVRRTAPLLGLAGAIALHSTWNTGASMGLFFFVIYGIVMVPAMIGLVIVAVFSLRGEGRVIHAYLAGDRESGTISDGEYRTLCSVRGRLRASCGTLFRHGWSAWRRRHVFHETASELAFLRHRVADGDEPPDPGLEAKYVATLIEFQARAT